MFIVYLHERRCRARRADAALDADRQLRIRRARRAPGFRRSAPSGMLGNAPAAGAPPAAAAVAPAPFTPSTSSTFAAGGATITADIANNALVIMAPEPVYNNLRAIIEKLDVRRAQVFVEALICEVSADKAAEFGIQWQALTGINTTQTRVIGGTNFTPRGSGSNIIDIAVNPGSVGAGPQPRRDEGHGHDSRPRHDHQPRVPRARARDAGQREHPVDADAAHARQRGSADPRRPEHPDPHRQYATTGSTTTVTPFQTFERKDIGLMLRVKPQITEGGTVRLVVYQEVSRIDQTIATNGAGPVIIEARARIVGRDRRQPDRRAGRAHRRPADRRLRQRSAAGADPDRGRALPLRRAAPGEDQPARVPEADRRAHGGRRPRRSRRSATTTCRASSSAGRCPSGSSGTTRRSRSCRRKA